MAKYDQTNAQFSIIVDAKRETFSTASRVRTKIRKRVPTGSSEAPKPRMTTPTDRLSQAPVEGLSVFSQDARPLGRDPVKALTREEIDKAHSYVLNSCVEVQPYFSKYREELKVGSGVKLSGRQQKDFAQWLKQHNESNKNSAAVAQIPDNISDSEHEQRISTEPQRSTSMSSTTSSRKETRKEQVNELVKTLEAELENERALTVSQKAELDSRCALTQVQKAELESQRALTLSQKVELESQRALTLSQKAELESQRALSKSQQTELESQRLLTRCQQAELESTRRVVQGQNQLLQDQQQLLKDQQERLKHFEDLVMNLHKSSDQSGHAFGMPGAGMDLTETIARMSTYKRKRV
ncbi:hypothetical protein C5167_019024 [Papaver somniferum]|uniref:Uncharacterized protein n=1 Tax=Papaver somniferum TaxID=3469 RepID=A0A4Y7ISY0_PAPSO|nr:hypothetical protein C5167_019024 [Papaver somniferum]